MRLLPILFIFFVLPVSAQVYKWTDENGVTHFGSQPPAGQQNEVTIRKSAPGTASVPSSRTIPSEQNQNPDRPPEKVPAAPTLADLERAAAQRACELAKSELASAERMLTLALSIDQSGPMADHRRNQVDLWQRRVRIECLGVE